LILEWVASAIPNVVVVGSNFFEKSSDLGYLAAPQRIKSPSVMGAFVCCRA
jgi:hypothetical protein